MSKRLARAATICLTFALTLSLIVPTSVLSLDNKSITPKAISEYYLDLSQHSASANIPGTVTNATTTDATRATFADGKIYTHAQGLADITLTMSNNDVHIYHVSSYYQYPQPKSAVIYTSSNGVSLSKGAAFDSPDYAAAGTLSAGEVVTILHRATDQNSTQDHVMQYIEKSNGQRGYIGSHLSSDRPASFYYNDVAIGDVSYSSTVSGGSIQTDAKSWTSTNPSVAAVASDTDSNGNANQGKVTGHAQGTTTVTVTLEYDSKSYKTSSIYTVYGKIANTAAKTNKQTYEHYAATTDVQMRAQLATNTNITITGQSGSFWRINTGRYVLKSDVDIPATSIKLDKTSALIYSGTSRALDLDATVSPSLATNKSVTWTSSNAAIATVDTTGKVTGHAKGTTTITAATTDGTNKSATAKVEVVVVATAITFAKPLQMATGTSATLAPEYTPKDSGRHTQSYASENTKVATVGTANGKVDAKLANGYTVITHKLTFPAPTVGSGAKPVQAQTVASVYTKYKNTFEVLTKAANKAAYIAPFVPSATKFPEYAKLKKTFANKYTPLKVIGYIGTSKAPTYYFVQYTDASKYTGFIKVTDTIKLKATKHKDLILNQKYVPKDGNTQILKSAKTKNKTVTAKTTVISGGSLIAIADGQLRAKGASGFASVLVAHTTTKGKTKTTKNHLLHITVFKNSLIKTPTAQKELELSQGAESTHNSSSIAEGSKFKVTGIAGKYYKIIKDNKIRYAQEDKATASLASLAVKKPTTTKKDIANFQGYINATTTARTGAKASSEHPELYYIYKDTTVKVTHADSAKSPKFFYITPLATDKIIKGITGYVQKAKVTYITAKATLAVAKGKSASVGAKLHNAKGAIKYDKPKNNNKASVDNSGKVTGNAVGNTTITASYNDGRAIAKCLVSVYKPIGEQGVVAKGSAIYSGASGKYKTDDTFSNYKKVTIIGKSGDYYYISYKEGGKTKYAWVKIDNALYIKMPETKTIYHYHSGTITATLSNNSKTDVGFSWRNSKGYIKQTKKSGNSVKFSGLKATKKGSPAILTASYTLGGVTIVDTCKVTVKEIKVNVTPKSLTLYVGDSEELKVKITPATSGKYTWLSSNSFIATVASDGKVMAKHAGKTTVTLKFKDFKRNIKVNVKAKEETYTYFLFNSEAVGGAAHAAIAFTVGGFMDLYSFQGSETSIDTPGIVAIAPYQITFWDAWNGRFDKKLNNKEVGILQRRVGMNNNPDKIWGEHYDKYIELRIAYDQRDRAIAYAKDIQKSTFSENPVHYKLTGFNCADFVLVALSTANIVLYNKENLALKESGNNYSIFPTIPIAIFNEAVSARYVSNFNKPSYFEHYPRKSYIILV